MLGIDAGEYWVQFLLDSPREDYQKLGATAYVPKTYDEYMRLFKELVYEKETHVAMGIVYSENKFGKIHESKEKLRKDSKLPSLKSNPN